MTLTKLSAGAVSSLIAMVVAGTAFPSFAEADFQAWKQQDAAIRRDAGKAVSAGEFRVVLPLGWTQQPSTNGDVLLRWIGPQAGAEAPFLEVVLRGEDAAGPDGQNARFVEWPSSFSGWAKILIGAVWALRAELPANRSEPGVVVVQIPATTSSLVAEFAIPAGGPAWPAPASELLKTVTYTGSGSLLTPPGESGSAASFGSARMRTRTPGRPLSDSSPLQAAAVEALKLLQSGADPAAGNKVAILDRGDDALLLRMHLIRSATRSIRIQTFIWDNDETGRLFMYELLEAAKRGVKVQVIADHISSMRDVDVVAFLATASPNLELRHYRPSAGRLDPNIVQESLDYIIPNDTNQRMHNKLLLLDDVAFITGGRNIANDYYNQSPGLNFRDRDVLVVGPMAAYAAGSFDEYWRYEESVPSLKLKDVAEAVRKGKIAKWNTREDFALHGYFDRLDAQLADSGAIRSKFVDPLTTAARAVFVADPPGKQTRYYTAWRRGTIARKIEEAMKTAEHELLLQTPYLVLDGGMLGMFRDMRKARPKLRLAVSSNSFGSTDNTITYAANFKLRPAYLRDAGLHVYEFMPRPAILDDLMPEHRSVGQRTGPAETRGAKGKGLHLCVHAKSFVVDDRLAYIGSYNFDPRSIALNTEVGLFVEDKGVAAQLRAVMLRDMAPENSWVINKREKPLDEAELARALPPAASRANVDLWPARFSTSFQLQSGASPTLPTDPKFYERYRDAGIFPGADEGLSLKIILTQILTQLTDLAMPLL